MPVPKTELVAARRATNTSPSLAQIVAGNYAKGKIRVHSLDISIENPKGSTRSGQSPDGKRWSQKMRHDYGYFLRTVGRDKDHVDVFLGPDLDSELVFVVNQMQGGGKRFDEHKVMLGFKNKEDAKAGYLANYEKGWTGLGDIIPQTLPQFRDWLYSPRTKRRLVVKQAELDWNEVPDEAIRLYLTAKEKTAEFRELINAAPANNLAVLWYSPDKDHAIVGHDRLPSSGEAVVFDKLAELATLDHRTELGWPGPGYVRVWRMPVLGKTAEAPKAIPPKLFLRASQALQLAPKDDGTVTPALSGLTPSPAASMVAGGLLGAGLGYGGGWLMERMMPNTWREGRTRRVLAMLGAMAGASPGAFAGLGNQMIGLPFNDSRRFTQIKAPESTKQADFRLAAASPSIIPAQHVTNILLHDAGLATQLPPEQRVMTAAIVQGATALPGRSRYITPMDMGRITAGMGSGYLSGLVVGKVLGALTGMPQDSQLRLRRAGTWAGAIANVAPLLSGF